MKVWIDDLREAPKGWIWVKSVNEAKDIILELCLHIDEISLDHDAGNFVKEGGDYIRLLDWMDYLENATAEFDFHNILFHIHSGNPVGKENILRIIEKNGWRYQS